MERYIESMTNYTTEITVFWDESRLQISEGSLRNWMNARTKHNVIDFFDESDNRICYTKRLYKSRVECFYQILKETAINDKIKEIISQSNSIVSFGCGPGPEIAAYISYVREDLQCNYLKLNIKAVDCLEQWGQFISRVAYLDDYATITFQAGLLSNSYLLNMNHSDVCIMSYPHAMNFEDIWANLKRKFNLIIFIDQAKGPLLEKARIHGFQFVNFFCKGSKTFFYYIAVKCKRGLHSMSYDTDICEENIDILLPCYHTFKMSCYKDEEREKLLNRCTVKVLNTCPRGIHNSYRNCGAADHCKEIREIQLSCGHKIRKYCDDDSSNSQSCSLIISKTCKRGYHSKRVACSSDFICDQKVSASLGCGHKFEFYCYEDVAEKKKTVKCNFKSIKHCQRGLHKIVSMCGSNILCQTNIEVERLCGHFLVVRCCDNESKEMIRYPCENIIPKACERQLHKTTMSCSTPFVCQQEVICKLDCGHKCAIKCCQNKSSVQCRNVVAKLCKRNIHKTKGECWKVNVCVRKCILYGKCGCKKLVTCDQFEEIVGNFICLNDDCKLKAKNRVPILQSIDYASEHEQGLCENISLDGHCESQCNKVLLCGHWCKWKCYQCLYGRLHRSCLEPCTRRVNCGHKCADYCHEGDCENCLDNCFIDRMKEFFRIKVQLPSTHQSEWLELIAPIISTVSNDLKELFEIILYNVKYEKFSDKEVTNYDTCFDKMKNILNLYDVLNSLYFPKSLQIYISYVTFSITNMLKWLDPGSCNISKSSLEDFDLEFKRVKTIITICQVAKQESTKFNGICELLNNTKNHKYNDDAIVDIYTNLNDILTV